jgi:hypothetical protein
VSENLRGFLIGLLVAGILQGCSISPARQEEIRKAWEERDAERAAERARECQLAGHCGSGGGP